MNDKAKIIMAVQDYMTRPKKKPKHKKQRRVADAKQKTLFQELTMDTQAQKKQIDVNADAFEKSLEAFKPAYYGTFTKAEKETLRRFFDLNQEAHRLGNQADSICRGVETFENQITSARRQYALFIHEGRVDDATSAVSTIPGLRKKQDDLRSGLPGIAARLTELEKEVSAIDHCKYLDLAKEAATAAEQSRCRAASIFGRPGEVQRSIAESKRKACDKMTQALRAAQARSTE